MTPINLGLLHSYMWFFLAALAEIGGCFAFWAWLKQGKSAFWVLPGVLSLIVFAWALTRVDSSHAGRAYAAYGGIYIVASVGWLWLAEGQAPDHWDLLGVAICVIGSLVILLAPREN